LDVPPDTRPIGSLLNADPCSAAFAREIHSCDLVGDKESEDRGIRTVDKRMLKYYDPQRLRREEND